MRFSTVFILAVTIGAATFANAAPSRGDELVKNVEFARDNLQVSNVNQARNNNDQPITKNVVRGVKNVQAGDKVNRRRTKTSDQNNLQRRDSWIWAEFTDDWGNDGVGYHDLYSTENFYVPNEKTKIKIHASEDQWDSFYIEKAWDSNDYQYLFQPYDGQLIDFVLEGTWFKFEQAYDDDKKKKAQ